MSEMMDVETLHQFLTEEKPVFILDVRNIEEYEKFHINGHLIPLAELANRLDEIPKDKTVVVHCHSGVRSAIAQNYLQQQGFEDVYNLQGGIVAWQKMFPLKK